MGNLLWMWLVRLLSIFRKVDLDLEMFVEGKVECKFYDCEFFIVSEEDYFSSYRDEF